MQKIKKIDRADPEKNASQTDGQTDARTSRIDFIEPRPQRWSFDHVFQKFKNKIRKQWSLRYIIRSFCLIHEIIICEKLSVSSTQTPEWLWTFNLNLGYIN